MAAPAAGLNCIRGKAEMAKFDMLADAFDD